MRSKTAMSAVYFALPARKDLKRKSISVLHSRKVAKLGLGSIPEILFIAKKLFVSK